MDRHFDGPLILKTTRSNSSGDAHRDFDGFDVDVELDRFRRATQAPAGEERDVFLIQAMMNIDEYLMRGGPLPAAWMVKRS